MPNSYDLANSDIINARDSQDNQFSTMQDDNTADVAYNDLYIFQPV